MKKLSFLLLLGVIMFFGSCKKTKLKKKNITGTYYCSEMYDPATNSYKGVTIVLSEGGFHGADLFEWTMDGYSIVNTDWTYFEPKEELYSYYENSEYIDAENYKEYISYKFAISVVPGINAHIDVRPELFYEDGEVFFLLASINGLSEVYKFVKQ